MWAVPLGGSLGGSRGVIASGGTDGAEGACPAAGGEDVRG